MQGVATMHTYRSKDDKKSLQKQKLWQKKIQVEVKESVDVLNQEIEILHKGIEVEELSVTIGNEKLGKLVRSKTIDLQKLLVRQSKISMSVKRKVELSSDIKEIEA